MPALHQMRHRASCQLRCHPLAWQACQRRLCWPLAVGVVMAEALAQPHPLVLLLLQHL